MEITNDVKYVGVNDHKVDLFEGQYVVKNGMSYNSYVIIDDCIAVLDTVDGSFGNQWLANIANILGSRVPDFLIIQHMEPDHSANINLFMTTYPNATIVSSAKAFTMMKNFYGNEYENRRIVVAEGFKIPLGKHTLNFVGAPMVHWPEVLFTYDSCDKILFSADGFGKFGALDVDDNDWVNEARRYYIGIVGKYGPQVQNVLKKAANLDIRVICPLHGPVLKENLGYYLNLYNTWSSYQSEEEGVTICYSSVYGNTANAVKKLANMLIDKGAANVDVFDLARCDKAKAIASAFQHDRLVLATTTYNADIFPAMREFIEGLVERNYQNKTIALIENGTWAPMANKIMKGMLEKCKNVSFLENSVTITSALNQESSAQLEKMANELCRDYIARNGLTANKNDLTALYRLGYGLYVVTTNDGTKDNGLIVNTVTQVSDNPNRIAVTINKKNYSLETIEKTGILNVNCLSTDAPFSLIQKYGFASGRNSNKFEGCDVLRSDNGLVFLSKHINAFISLKVVNSVDLDSHIMFICNITEARVINDNPSMTYAYYQSNVKPKPEAEKKGWVCKVCGYIYEGEDLPEDYICPLCKHGASDFEKL